MDAQDKEQYAESELDEKDVAAIMDKAKSGKLLTSQDMIDPVHIELDSDSFPEIKEEKEGAKVVMVLSGTVRSVDDDGAIVCFWNAAMVHGNLPPLGSGERFKKLEGELADKPGIYNPAGLAAAIGRRKFGNARFAKLSAKGRKNNGGY